MQNVWIVHVAVVWHPLHASAEIFLSEIMQNADVNPRGRGRRECKGERVKEESYKNI